jgi:ribosomal protein S18 acetylase RimI-like enzyme
MVAVALARSLIDTDLPAVAAIVSGLPDYFTDDVPEKVQRDARSDPAWVLVDDEEVVGFAVAKRESDRGAEILWMAIEDQRRGHGHGTILLNRLLADLAADGVLVVEVKTLDRSANYPPYEATRAFWERRGFVHIDTIDPLPGWQEGNPAAIYVAALSETR